MKPDALHQIVTAAVDHRRSVLINWSHRFEGDDRPSPFPMMQVKIDDQSWHVFFDGNRTGGWSLDKVIGGNRERRGLAKLLAAIEADSWIAA